MKHALFRVKANVDDDFDHTKVNWNDAIPGAQLIGFSLSDAVPSTQGIEQKGMDSSVVHGARAGAAAPPKGNKADFVRVPYMASSGKWK